MNDIQVLHVDDDTGFAEVTATYLEREDNRMAVQTAHSPEDGVRVVAENEIDCIVSDYDMHHTNGIEFLETIREKYPNLPFILFTGKGSEEVASEAIRVGVTDYLQKGSGSDQYALLANRIQNAVEQQRATRQAAEQDRVNTVVRKINDALARATTRTEVDERVCEIISDAEPYLFAWIGEHVPESQTVEPRAADGIGAEYLDTIEVTTDEAPTAMGPTGQAVQEQELAVTQNIVADPQYEPWRQRALEQGYRASAAVPFVYDDRLYGVLNVYADRTGAFGEQERELLSDLGETIAHAYHRIELQRQYTDQYRALFEEAPVMVVFTRTVDGEPVIEGCNQTFADRLGYTREELEETPLATYYTDRSAEALLGKNGYQRALTGEFVREQRSLVTCDGDEILTLLRASPRRDRNGKIIGTHALYLDITNEQQVQELEQTNALLSTLFDTLPQGILAEDGSREVLTVNQQLFDIFAVSDSPEDAIGRDCKLIAEEVSGEVSDPERFTERIGELVSGCDSVDTEEIAMADGRTLERSYRPIELPEGGYGHLWVYDDVTERVEYQEIIENLQYRTQKLISLQDKTEIASEVVEIAEETFGFPLSGVHFVDDDYETLYPATVTDQVREHLGDQPVYERTEPSRSTDAFNWQVFENGEPVVIENAHTDERVDVEETPSRSGIIYPLGDHGLFITSSAEPNAFDTNDVNLVDILATIVTAVLDRAERETELREQKRLFKEKNERLDEFASIVSHDLRNPLNVASLRLELAQENYTGDHLDKVEQAHNRMETLIQDLLALARDGSEMSDREPTDLTSLVESCWSNVETTDATLTVDLDCTVLANESRLKQVFENLIRNAVEHGGENVTVSIGKLVDGFYLSDDGPGIPASRRDDVFESSYSTSQDGTGFGLSIVKHIVEAHGWNIRVTDGPEGGARFEITGVKFVEG